MDPDDNVDRGSFLDSYEFVWWKTLNPFYWIYIYYTSMIQWIYIDNFNYVAYFVIICYGLQGLAYVLRELGFLRRKQKAEIQEVDKVKQQTEQMMTEMKEEEQAKSKSVQSIKPKTKPVVRSQKKEMLKAKMRKGGPQAGPSGVVMGFEVEHDPGCACESCINDVD